MNTQYISRFALTMTLAFAAVLPLQAETAAPEPAVINFAIGGAMIAPTNTSTAQADVATVSQQSGLITVGAHISDTTGLRTVSLYGYNRNASVYMPAGTKSTSLGLFWNVKNCPVGDYTFHCTAVDAKNMRTDKDVVIHVVP